MSKRIWSGGMVLLVAVFCTVGLGQESEDSAFGALFGVGQVAGPSGSKANEPIDELRGTAARIPLLFSTRQTCVQTSRRG